MEHSKPLRPKFSTMKPMTPEYIQQLSDAAAKAREAMQEFLNAWWELHKTIVKQLVAWAERINTYVREELMLIQAWENEGGSLIHYTRERVYVF